jgi:hypothetical protein
MSAGKILLIAAAVLGLSVHLYHGHQRAALQREMGALADENGFVPVQMPNGLPRGMVVILAPVNCPSAGAKRADDLAGRLRALGIPAVRANQYRAEVRRDNRDSLERAAAVLQGDVPAVFFNGKGKSNPTAEEVVDEYRVNQ